MFFIEKDLGQNRTFHLLLCLLDFLLSGTVSHSSHHFLDLGTLEDDRQVVSRLALHLGLSAVSSPLDSRYTSLAALTEEMTCSYFFLAGSTRGFSITGDDHFDLVNRCCLPAFCTMELPFSLCN